MVRDVFRLAKENAPAIIFIDEVDAIATARFDAQTGADREVQRILMELLNQVKAWSTMTSALDLLFLILLNIVAFKNGPIFRLRS
jgi:26S proteasome regulatory subunit T3